MPFSRPTLTNLRAQIAADIQAGLDADALLRYSNLGILGDALAAMVNGLYGYLDWIAKESVPFTADGEYSVAWGALKGVTLKPAVAASGTVNFTGVDGKTVLAGTNLTRSDGAGFATAADATISAGSATTAITALDEGAAGNSPAGTILTLGSGVSGVNNSATVATAIAGGADVEDPDSFRARMLAVYASPPQGGAASDYIEWAEAVPGVTRAWVIPSGMGVGTVVVLFMMDAVESVHDGFPQGASGVATLETRDTAATGDQLVVANALYPLRPVTALVYAAAPGRNTLNFTIAGLSGASMQTKAAVIAAIKSALQVGASPGGVALADGSAGGVTPLSTIEGAVAAIPAATGFVITTITASAGTVTPGAAGNVTSNAGFLPVLGAVTFS